jgi:competence protein ComEC
MPLFVLSFLAGILFVQQLSQLPTLDDLQVVGLLFVVCLYKKSWNLTVGIFGIIWTITLAQCHLSQQLPENKEGVALQVSGYISSLPQYNDKRVRFDFNVDSPQNNFPRKLRLNWYTKDQILKAGQYWQFTVKLKRPHGSLNPFGFDYERFLFTQGIGATGYVRPSKPILVAEKNKKYSISVWRQQIADKLEQTLAEGDNLALIKALSIGERSQVTDEQWLLLRKTGTNHLLAISGLHIGLVAGLVFFITRKLWAWMGLLICSAQTIAAYSALLAAICYSALADFSIPTQRALMMLVVAMMLMVHQRHLPRSTTLAIILFLVLFINPFAVLSGGFWLSFSAVFILLYCGCKRLGQTHWTINILKTHPILALGLSPLLLLFFQQASIVSPLANMIAIPWVSFIIVPLILSAVLLMFLFPWLATQLLLLANINLGFLFEWLQLVSNLPFSSINHPEPSLWATLLAVIAILLLLAPKGIPTRRLAFILLLPLLFGQQNHFNQGEFSVNLLDVGQGLATVVQTANHLLVFDTGVKYSANFDMGKMVVLPYLQGIGVSKIDRLIISHGDNDHIGGMESLIENITIGDIYSSINKPNLKACISGQQWQWDGVNFEILSPTKSRFSSKNNNSCVLKIESIYGSALLTGDIEAGAERSLVKRVSDNLKSDVLIAPHHGSKTSSTWNFLQKVDPQWILIPVGYKNRFNHPHPQVLKRYQQQGYQWFSTAKGGALQVFMTQKGQKLMSYRDKFGKYWNAQ